MLICYHWHTSNLSAKFYRCTQYAPLVSKITTHFKGAPKWFLNQFEHWKMPIYYQGLVRNVLLKGALNYFWPSFNAYELMICCIGGMYRMLLYIYYFTYYILLYIYSLVTFHRCTHYVIYVIWKSRPLCTYEHQRSETIASTFLV